MFANRKISKAKGYKEFFKEKKIEICQTYVELSLDFHANFFPPTLTLHPLEEKREKFSMVTVISLNFSLYVYNC